MNSFSPEKYPLSEQKPEKGFTWNIKLQEGLIFNFNYRSFDPERELAAIKRPQSVPAQIKQIIELSPEIKALPEYIQEKYKASLPYQKRMEEYQKELKDHKEEIQTHKKSEKFQKELAEYRQKIEKYKRELINQKIGIAEIQEKLFETVEKSPDLTTELLTAIVADEAPKYRLNETQIRFFFLALREYTSRHQKIRELRRQFSSDEELFEHCFSKKPTGKIRVMEGPLTLHFQCYDDQDLAFVYSNKYLARDKGQELTPEDIKKIEDTRGLFVTEGNFAKMLTLAKRPPETEFTPEHKIAPEQRATFRHEEQHAYYSLYIAPNPHRATFQKFTDQTLPPVEKIKYLKGYLRHLRFLYMDEKAKNEILAYYKTGRSLHRIEELILTHHAYDYFPAAKKEAEECLKRHLKEKISDVDSEGLIKDIFTNNYTKQIIQAITAIEKLERMGYSRKKIILLLSTEPLNKWAKMSKMLSL